MALNNDGTSNDGYMKCKLGGSFVGESLCISISLVKLIERFYKQYWKLKMHLDVN